MELRQVAAAARTAIAAQHVKHADAFPAQSNGVFGMMKGGGLKTVGYSKDGHANQPITFMDCLDGGCHRCCALPSIDLRWRLAHALPAPPACLHACLPRAMVSTHACLLSTSPVLTWLAVGQQTACVTWRFVRGAGAACYDDCRCLGFHWSGKHARCGLKADGNIPVRHLT